MATDSPKPPEGEKLKVLFLCTGNSCRSQMAEGFARQLKGDEIEAWSAGVETHGLNPTAVRVMDEVGVDISSHRSKRLDEIGHIRFDYVVTVCDSAAEACPTFPRKVPVLHVPFDDPPRLARGVEGQEEELAIYRRVRDDIRRFVESLPGSLSGPGRAIWH